jgi:hypothetical protein
MKRAPRESVVRLLLTEDEKESFKSACNDVDISGSKFLRDCALDLIEYRKSIRKSRESESAATSYNMAKFCPGRSGYKPIQRMSMRL